MNIPDNNPIIPKCRSVIFNLNIEKIKVIKFRIIVDNIKAIVILLIKFGDSFLIFISNE